MQFSNNLNLFKISFFLVLFLIKFDWPRLKIKEKSDILMFLCHNLDVQNPECTKTERESVKSSKNF